MIRRLISKLRRLHKELIFLSLIWTALIPYRGKVTPYFTYLEDGIKWMSSFLGM